MDATKNSERVWCESSNDTPVIESEKEDGAITKAKKLNMQKDITTHAHKWLYAGMCTEKGCGLKTYHCQCGAYKNCDKEIID